jgi:hypothetical protein
MPQYEVDIPGQGTFLVESPTELTDRQAYMMAMREAYAAPPEAPAKKGESGFVPSLKAASAEALGSAALTAGKLGLMDPAAAEAYYKEKEKYAKETFAPTEESWSQAPWTKFKELAGGSLPYMAAPIVGALAAPEAAAGAGLASLAQFTGTNLARQLETGKSLEQASLGSAAAAAVPQAALDVLSFKMIPGIRGIFGSAGLKLSENELEQITMQGLTKTVGDYAAATGKAMTAEGLTEAAQQFFERMQAGLSINDEEVRKEYWDNLVGGAILGGAIAPFGHAYERTGLKAQQKGQPTPVPTQEVASTEEAVPEPTLREEAAVPEDVAAAAAEGPVKLSRKEKANVARAKKEQEDYLRKYAAQAEDRAAAIAEYQRVRDMSPEEYAADQLAGTVKAPKKGLTQEQMQAEAEAAGLTKTFPPEAKPHEKYAAEQIALAKDREPLPNWETYTQYLLQNPTQARALVDNQTQIPGVPAAVSDKILRTIDKTLSDREAQAKQAEEQRVATAQERARGMFEAEPVDLLGAAREQPGVQRREVVKNEQEALSRIGNRPAPYLTAARDIEARRNEESMVDALVDSFPKSAPVTPGQVYRGLGTQTKNIRDLQAQLAIARLTRNREEMRRIKDLLDEERTMQTEGGLGLLTREAQAEIGGSRLPEARAIEAEADKLNADQRNTMLGLARLLTTNKISLPETRNKQISAIKEQFVTQHLAEIETRRRAFGLPEMADWERAEARARALEGLNALVDNPDNRTLTQMVGNLQTIARDSIYNNISNAAKRFAKTEEQKIGNKPLTGPRVGAPDELTLKGEPRIAGEDKRNALETIERVLSTLATRTRAVPTEAQKAPTKVKSLEDMAKLFADEKGTASSAALDSASVDLLEQLRDALPQTSDPEFISLAREQAQQIAEGNLPSPDAVRDLAEMMRAQKEAGRSETAPGATQAELQRTSAQPQMALFPEAEVATTRATPTNFQRLLDSGKIKELREAIQAQKEANLKALQDFGKTVPTLDSKLEKAKTKYDRKLKKAQQAAELKQAFAQEFQDDLAAATEAVTQWNEQVVALKERMADIEAARQAVMQAPMNAELWHHISPILSQENAVRRQLAKAERGLGIAREFEAAVRATNQANESLAKPAFDRADKADKELAQAAQERQAAESEIIKEKSRADRAQEREEKAKQDALKSDTARFNESLQNAREGMGLPVERLTKQTSTPEMRAREHQLRSKMGGIDAEITKKISQIRKLEAQGKVEEANKLAKATKDRMAELQESYDQAEEDLHKLYEEAQLTRADEITAADLAFEEAQIKLASLPARRAGPVVTDVRTARKSQAGQRVDVVGRADKVTDALIARRSELAEFERRKQYLQDNNKPVTKQLENAIKAAQKKVATAEQELKAVGAEERAARVELAVATKGITKKDAARLAKEAKLREANPDFETVPFTPIKKTVAEAIRDGRILDALDDVAESGSTQFVRDLAERLRPLLMRTKISTQPDLVVDGKAANGAYYPADNAVVLDDNALSEESFMHELTHAATLRVLRTPDSELTPSQRKAKQDLQALYDQIKNDPAYAKEYAKKDLEEFVSEVMSNGALQSKLAATKVEDTNLWDRFKNFMLRLVGIDNRADAFKTATEAIDKIFLPSQKITAEAKASLFRQQGAPGFEEALSTANDIIATKPTLRKQIEANLGLAFRTQVLDRLAPLEKVAKEFMDPLKGMQMMFYLRMADQKMSFVQQSVARGVPQIVEYQRKDGQTERLIESKDGPSLAKVVNILKDVKGMDHDSANRLFTLYLAGKRAERVGADKLNFKMDPQRLKNAVAQIESNDDLRNTFEAARKEYNAYNKNLMNFLAETGAVSPELAAELAKTDDYIPYYRERNGNAELVIGSEGAYKIGNLADQPQLRQLIGGENKIFDFLTSSVQNTSMIMDMGLRNLATKNAMYELQQLGLARFVGTKTSGPDVVHFKDKGADKYVVVETDSVGIPPQLLVKGMEGIPVNNSALVKAMAMPATLLRRAVTMSPVYSARQIFRDSVAAPLLSGANMTPVMSAIQQVGKSATREKLESRGVVGGQVFTGTNEDLTRILGEFQSGKIGLSQLVAKAEAMAMEADALTRRAQYDSYIEQGLSEMEATMMSLESMNFNRKGLSPSVRMASSLIPFFNAQLQSLDVLYRAMTGKMPMNERLDIQGKLYRRGALLAGTAVAYAMLMQDEETYKNAQPEEKYGNFFIPLPGMKEALRVPVPFEIGYIFKGIPEALVNSMASDTGAEEAYKAFKSIALQTVPGASSGFLPAAVKPFVENQTNYSFFTGRPIESRAEQMREAEFRYRDNTSEVAKGLGGAIGVSPLKIENLIRGYTGTMGMATTQALSMAVPTAGGPEQATKRLTDRPVIGSMFQPADAGGMLSDMYDHMTHIKQVQATYKELLTEGRRSEAQEYAQRNINAITMNTLAGNLQEHMGKIKQAEAAINASSLSPDEKRERLDRLRDLKIRIAQNVRGALERTKPQ